MKNRLTVTNVFVLAVLGCLVLLNLLSLRMFGRLDVTRDRTYSLGAATRETLSQLKDSLTVTAYFTENLPAPYAGNARYVRDLLDEMRAASHGNLSFEFIDPQSQETQADKDAKKDVRRNILGQTVRAQTSVEKELAGLGVQGVEIRVVEQDQMQTKRAYMGLVLRHGEKKEVVPLVQGIDGLEYELTRLMRKLTREKTPVVAVLQGHDEPKLEEHLRKLKDLLGETYEVRPLTLGAQESIPADISALLVLGPKTPLAPNEVKAIDQFVMKGKSVGLFLDIHQAQMSNNEGIKSWDADSGLAPLLASYGIKLGDHLVADAQAVTLSVRNGMYIMPVLYPFILKLRGLEGGNPITKGLTQVVFPYATSLEVTPVPGEQVSVMARSSAKSWLEAKPFNIDPGRDWQSETITPQGPYTLMAQVTGKLKSHFAPEATASSTRLLADSQGDARVLVGGGSMLFWDDFMTEPNQVLLANIADWLALDPALLALRSRSVAATPLKAEVSDGTRNGVKFGNALGLPLLLVLYGVARWRWREGRRAKAAVI